jgi:hypothetical protein
MPVYLVHPTPPMKAGAVSNNANALSCCNPITRRRNPSHVGPHRHSHRDLYQLRRPPTHPSTHHLLRQAYFPPSPGGLRCGCPAGKHEAPSSATIGPTPRSFARSLWSVACMNHAPLHIPLYRYPSIPPPSAHSTPNRRPYLAQGGRDYLIYAGRRVASSPTWKRRCRCTRGVHFF